jgi:AmiR/NasT family two-component response regulator
VVAADEVEDRLRKLVDLLRQGGHTVVAAETDFAAVRRAIENASAELAVVSIHAQPAHGLELIEMINDTADCPIVLLLDGEDPSMVREALERGLDAYATSHTVEALQSAIALARRRFVELDALGRQVRDREAGAERRALIEQAKGVLMERHDIDDRTAYHRLRAKARADRISLAEVARSVLRARGLLRPADDDD